MNETLAEYLPGHKAVTPRLLLLIGANAVILLAAIFLEYEILHDENGMIENLQGALLAIGVLLYLLRARLLPQHRAFNAALALLCFSFLLRELDVEQLDVPALFHLLGSGTGKRLLLAALWATMLWWLCREYRTPPLLQWKPEHRQLRYLATIVAMFLISLVMDRELVDHQHSRLFEELAETNAYLLIVCAGLAGLIPGPRQTAPACE